MNTGDTLAKAAVVCARTIVLFLLLVLTGAVAHAKATVVTLPELIKQSELILYGRVRVENRSSSSVTVPYEVVRVIKGADSVHSSTVSLCNPPTKLDRPDLSKMHGDSVLFLVNKGSCLALSHSYRSVVPVNDDRASTVAIRGQPDERPLESFLDEVKKLAAK